MSSPLTFHPELLPAGMLLRFEADRLLRPDDLRELQPPDPVQGGFAHHGVILSGRGPVWLLRLSGPFLPSLPVCGSPRSATECGNCGGIPCPGSDRYRIAAGRPHSYSIIELQTII